MSTNTKPLGSKAYGHIPHLPGSRMTPGDHHCHEGQARICTLKVRDRHDRIIVQEKLDGSCVSVARIDGVIVPLTRAGWAAWTSPYKQHHLFGQWVMNLQPRWLELLHDGERVCGEWLAQAHGTRYALPHEPFVAFDLFTDGRRLPFEAFEARAKAVGLVTPRLIHEGGPFSIEQAIAAIEDRTHHGALDPVEGAVWRVERRGAVEFLAKFVRPEKVDGLYLPEISGREPVWNWQDPDARDKVGP